MIIARAGKPVAQIVPILKGKRRGAGIDEGLGFIAEDFDAELPPEILAAFYK